MSQIATAALPSQRRAADSPIPCPAWCVDDNHEPPATHYGEIVPVQITSLAAAADMACRAWNAVAQSVSPDEFAEEVEAARLDVYLEQRHDGSMPLVRIEACEAEALVLGIADAEALAAILLRIVQVARD